MTEITMKFQVYLMYILGDIESESLNFCDVFLINFVKVFNSLMTSQIIFLHVNLKCFTCRI